MWPAQLHNRQLNCICPTTKEQVPVQMCILSYTCSCGVSNYCVVVFWVASV